MSSVQDGQILEACLFLLDQDPHPHPSFGCPVGPTCRVSIAAQCSSSRRSRSNELLSNFFCTTPRYLRARWCKPSHPWPRLSSAHLENPFQEYIKANDGLSLTSQGQVRLRSDHTGATAWWDGHHRIHSCLLCRRYPPRRLVMARDRSNSSPNAHLSRKRIFALCPQLH